MQNRTGDPSHGTSLKIIIARASIAIGIACLAAQAFSVRVVHHSLWLTILGMLPPALGVLGSLYYLRSMRGQS